MKNKIILLVLFVLLFGMVFAVSLNSANEDNLRNADIKVRTTIVNEKPFSELIEGNTVSPISDRVRVSSSGDGKTFVRNVSSSKKRELKVTPKQVQDSFRKRGFVADTRIVARNELPALEATVRNVSLTFDGKKRSSNSPVSIIYTDFETGKSEENRFARGAFRRASASAEESLVISVDELLPLYYEIDLGCEFAKNILKESGENIAAVCSDSDDDAKISGKVCVCYDFEGTSDCFILNDGCKEEKLPFLYEQGCKCAYGDEACVPTPLSSVMGSSVMGYTFLNNKYIDKLSSAIAEAGQTGKKVVSKDVIEGILKEDLVEKKSLNCLVVDSQNSYCLKGACKENVCGDKVVLEQEECDDGNNKAGDGCSNCENDFCGDGVVSTILGEECDDSAAVDGDGCSSKCKVEIPENGLVDLYPIVSESIASTLCVNYYSFKVCNKGEESFDEGSFLIELTVNENKSTYLFDAVKDGIIPVGECVFVNNFLKFDISKFGVPLNSADNVVVNLKIKDKDESNNSSSAEVFSGKTYCYKMDKLNSQCLEECDVWCYDSDAFSKTSLLPPSLINKGKTYDEFGLINFKFNQQIHESIDSCQENKIFLNERYCNLPVFKLDEDKDFFSNPADVVNKVDCREIGPQIDPNAESGKCITAEATGLGKCIPLYSQEYAEQQNQQAQEQQQNGEQSKPVISEDQIAKEIECIDFEITSDKYDFEEIGKIDYTDADGVYHPDEWDECIDSDSLKEKYCDDDVFYSITHSCYEDGKVCNKQMGVCKETEDDKKANICSIESLPDWVKKELCETEKDPSEPEPLEPIVSDVLKKCEDSDVDAQYSNGKNFGKAGVVTITSSFTIDDIDFEISAYFSDNCFEYGTNVNEAFCEGNDVKFSSKDCYTESKGCVQENVSVNDFSGTAGSCVLPQPDLMVCNDIEDNGLNYSVAGETSAVNQFGQEDSEIDYCVEGTNDLIEYFCTESESYAGKYELAFTEPYDCTDEGKKCEFGACVVQ